MSETGSFLVTKTIQPRGAYRQQMHERDFRQIESEILLSEPGTIIEVADLTEEEVEDRRSDARPHVLSVEPNRTATIPEPEISAQAAERISSAEAEKMVGLDELKRRGITGKGMVVAIHDTGIHPTLYERYKNRIAGLLNLTNDADAFDRKSLHGSWVFSVLAYALPDAKFLIVKVLSSENGSGQYSWIIKGVNDSTATCHGGNASLGGPKSSAVNSTYDAADGRGLIMGVAAGNEQRGRTNYVADETSPASAARTMTVAAKQSDGRNPDFSNWGNCVRIAAPGVFIQCPDADVVSKFYSGTSMAVYAFAVAMLLRSAGYEKEAVKQAIYASAKDLQEPAYMEGAGMVDSVGALAKLSPQKPPETKPPTPVRVGLSGLSANREKYYGKELVLYEKLPGKPARDLWRATPIKGT